MVELRNFPDVKRADLLWFDPRKLEIKPGLNARDFDDPDNKAHVKDIAASIIANGFYPDKPIAIFKEKGVDGVERAYIADGECRWRAAMLAIEGHGLDLKSGVACVAMRKDMGDVDLVLHRNLSNTGKRFTALEEGRNIKHAVALGATVKEVAARLAKSESYVNQLLELQAAPQEIHNAVQAGEIAPTEAIKVVREHGPEAAKGVIKAAVASAKARGKGKATARDLRPPPPAKEGTLEVLPDCAVTCFSGFGADHKVTFGGKPVIMTRPDWVIALKTITKHLHIRYDEIAEKTNA